MRSIVALDIETTGLDNVRDAMIEIGAVRFNERRVEGEFHTLLNPRRAIPTEITRLTGITNEMVRRAPMLQEVRDDLEAFVGDAPVLGHNVSFDMGFLQQRGILGLNEIIDTYALATVLLPTASRYNLGSLGQLLGIPFPATHRALDDARVTHQIFVQLLDKIRALPLDLLAEITRLGDPFDWGGDVIFRQVMRERAKETLGAGPGGDGYGPLFEGMNRVGGRVPRMDQRPAPLIPDPVPTPLDPDNVAAILEYGGEFSRHFPQFEHRAEQVEMLRTVAWALSEGRHLMVEAGTGTGKSVAYLVPASLWALQNNTRVVVSTNTINLQDQLVGKDIPDIIEALDVPLRAAVLKGRSNYLCPRRFETMRRQGPESAEEVRLLAKTLVWLMEGGSGDRQEINLHAGERYAWERVSAADDACTNDTCMRRAGGVCPFYRARQAAQNAHVIIINHALLLADVATGNRVLPEYQYLIVDEAHHMEAAVTNALSFRISQSEVERTMRELGSTNGGVLGRLLTTLHDVIQPSHYAAMYALAEQATTSAIYFQNASRNFFVEIDNFLAAMREGRDIGPYSQQVRILPATRTQPAWMEVETIWDEAGASLRSLRAQLEQIAKGMVELMEGGFEGTEDAYGDLSNLFRRLSEIDIQMEGLVFKPDPNQVYWAEVQSDGRRLSLNVAPLHIGPLMQEHLWHQKSSVILTSATLTTHGEFTYLQGRLFGQDADTVALGSPFDYESSTLLYVPNNIPEPTDRYGHQRAVEQGLIHLCRMTGGRALALFTSYEQLKRTSEAISGPLAEHGIIVYEQGTGASATALLENFKTSEQAVLLGTRSFWEGVDVPGEALSVLAIIKLPFDVPSDPIIAARAETFDNAFQEYTLPEAILRFRQGFGRLIRTKFDRGVVAIFDRRVLTKTYGRLFVESLPQCTVQVGPLQELPGFAGQWLNL